MLVVLYITNISYHFNKHAEISYYYCLALSHYQFSILSMIHNLLLISLCYCLSTCITVAMMSLIDMCDN